MSEFKRANSFRGIAGQRWEYLLINFGLLASAVVGWLAVQFSTEFSVTIALILLFSIILFIEPVWALISALYLYLWFSYVDLYLVPPHNYAILFTSLFMLPGFLLKDRLHVNKAASKIITVSLGFVGWSIVVDFLNGVPLNSIVLATGRFVIQMLIFLCVVFLLKNKVRFTVFLYGMIIGVAISSFVAIMQFLNVDLFWQLRILIGINPNSAVGQQILTRARVPGLAYFSIPLANQLSMVIPFLLGILMVPPLSGDKDEKIFLWIILFVLFGGLFATMTRSAIAGVSMGFLIIAFMLRQRRVILATGVWMLIILLLIFFIEPVRRRFFYPDESAYARIPMALAALKIWLSNPLGVGVGQYSTQAEQFFVELEHFIGAQQILYTGAHNQFLNTLVYYGFPGFLLLLILYKRVFGILVYLWKNSQSSWGGGVALGLLGGFGSYIVNSLFHNPGPFIGDPFHWYFIGLAVALYSID